MLNYTPSGNRSLPYAVDGYLFSYDRNVEVPSSTMNFADPCIFTVNYIQIIIHFISYNRNTGKSC